jgi:hypothetical protein
MTFKLDNARNYVSSIDLKGTPRAIVGMSAATEASEVFDKAKTQAQVVGSGVFSFAKGVDAMVREAISDSALLAQLVANKRFNFEQKPHEWFTAYKEVLENVGWTLQDAGWTEHPASGKAVEVHEKIIEIMTAILGPVPAALAILTSTINALRAMKPDSSWITIFSRESQKANIARFQVGLVEQKEDDDVFVALLFCLIEAQDTITQVLVFKYTTSSAKFSVNNSKVSLNREAFSDLGPTIRAKIRAYQADYLSSIKDI